MCGIAGVVGLTGQEERTGIVTRMSARLAHRGPDHDAVLPGAEATLGHRRLAIIDLSPGGRQPMVRGNLSLVLNGEIYNHQQLREELKPFNPDWQSRSDTETLLVAFRYLGDSAIEKLRGMFAFSIWDADKRRLFCARDPFGKKPFYFHHSPAGFVFASEIEAVVAAIERRPDPSAKSLASFLLRGHMAAGESIYEGVSTLKAGHCLEFDAASGSVRTWAYSVPRFSLSDGHADDAAVADQAAGRLRTAVDTRLLSDVPVGALLSGGVDSSLVCLNAPKSMTAFTAAFPGSSADESPFAAQVATEAGLQLKTVNVALPAFETLLDRLVTVFGEPFGDQSAIPALALFEGLKGHVKVALTGDGADEVFAGYADGRLFWWRDAVGAGDRRRTLMRGLSGSLATSKSRSVRTLAFGLASMTMPGDELFVFLYREGWTAEWRRRLMRPNVWQDLGEETPENEVRKAFMAAGRSDLERYLNMNLERLTEDYLVKIDRTSMAHSIEARCPFLDVDLASWAMHLPAETLLRRGRPKRVLKDLLARRMGAAFANRRKAGFTPPLDAWLRDGAMSAWVTTNLLKPDGFVSSLIGPAEVRDLVASHMAGENHTGRLWRLLFLNAWHARAYS